MLYPVLKDFLTEIKKFNIIKLLQEQNRYIGVPGVYIPNKNLPSPFRIQNPLKGMANY